MGMIAAFDASGDECSQLILVVAGFISSAGDWEDFSKKWLDRLQRDGIKYMHMKEYAHSTGQFADGWKGNKPRRDALLGDLMDILSSHTYRKFGMVITNETFRNSISAETQKEWHLNAYSLAGRSCAKQINEWAMEERYRSPIELVFEKGDIGSGKLHARLVEDGYQAPSFKPKKDEFTPEGVLIPAFVPLHAADFLAYELFLEVTRIAKGDTEHAPRWAFLEFYRKVGDIGTYKIDDLKRFQSMVDLTKTVDEWALSKGLLKKDEQGRLYREIKTKTCTLPLFVWGKVYSDSGMSMTAPVCLSHRPSRILWEKSGTRSR
jgi:hypothetical protein